MAQPGFPAANAFQPSLPAHPLVLVTGGAGGLGREIATQFLEHGARVHVCDIDAAALRELSVQHDPRWLRSSCADIADPQQTSALFEDVGAWDCPVSVLVNNVGIAGARASVDELTDTDWLESLNANFMGAVRCVRHVKGDMKRAGAGVILNISTVSVRTVPPSRAVYVVSKAALEALSMSLARELGVFGIRSNVIRPGGMDNERMHKILRNIAETEGLDWDTVMERELASTSMRTLVSMRDVAAMAAYLASDLAKHITGQVIEVDGGVQWET